MDYIGSRIGRKPNGSKLWCPVLGNFGPETHRITAHIVPYMLGQRTDLWKDSADELFSARNGMTIDREVEKVFDIHQVVFVPATPVPVEGPIKDWKFKILDKTLLKKEAPNGPKGEERTWADLDGKLLEFRTEARPAARYLYYHYVVSLLRSQRHCRKGWEANMTKEIA